jgi:PPOX class probable F420-dependent enzyme
MANLPNDLRELIQTGPLAHLSTINPDGSPQVTVIWIGLDDDAIVSGHMRHHKKLKNIERDPRVVLSFEAPRDRGVVMNPYAVLRARASVEPSDAAWDLLDRLTKIYVSADTEFPAPKGPGYIIRYEIERVSGVGPWATNRR